MSNLIRPMLAAKCDDVEKLNFPLWVTPKLDGIRALKVDGKLLSRTFKPIPNVYIRETLEKLLPDGIDGEIMAGSTFQEVTSAVMSFGGEPEFTYFAFDYVKDNLEKPYMARMYDLNAWWMKAKPDTIKLVQPIIPEKVDNLEQLKSKESQYISQGYEGIMARTEDSPYKCGRASMKTQWLVKIKKFSDSEARILNWTEKMKNENEAEKDAFGRTKRSTCKENKTPAGVLGAFEVEDIYTGVKFSVGSGFNDEQKASLWQLCMNDPDKILGKIIKYNYFEVGVKDAPRFPTFVGFRDPEDM